MRELKEENEFFDKCYDSKIKQYKTLGTLIEFFLLLKQITNLSPEEQDSFKRVLNYLKIQRDKQVHYHPKSWDYHVFRLSVYEYILYIYELFEIKLPKRIITKIQNLNNYQRNF